jgi:hypothetical protein
MYLGFLRFDGTLAYRVLFFPSHTNGSLDIVKVGVHGSLITNIAHSNMQFAQAIPILLRGVAERSFRR